MNESCDCYMQCATQAGAIWEVVKQCVESKAGMLLQLQAEQTTSHYKPQFIPTIVYDKVRCDSSIQLNVQK